MDRLHRLCRLSTPTWYGLFLDGRGAVRAPEGCLRIDAKKRVQVLWLYMQVSRLGSFLYLIQTRGTLTRRGLTHSSSVRPSLCFLRARLNFILFLSCYGRIENVLKFMDGRLELISIVEGGDKLMNEAKNSWWIRRIFFSPLPTLCVREIFSLQLPIP